MIFLGFLFHLKDFLGNLWLRDEESNTRPSSNPARIQTKRIRPSEPGVVKRVCRVLLFATSYPHIFETCARFISFLYEYNHLIKTSPII